jgi:hypothetical protein
MKSHLLKSIFIALLVGVFAVTCAGMAAAQASKPAAGPESHNAVALGGPASFTPPMKDVAALQKVFARPRLQTDLRKVFAEAGVENVTDRFLKAIADGEVKDTSVPVGSTMEWMASRSPANRTPHLLRNVTWSGKKPFDAFEIVIDDMVRTYTFWIPKVCGNIAMGVNEPSREKARLDAEAAEKARLEAEQKARDAAAEKARQDALAKQKAEQARIEAEKAAAAAAAAAENARQDKERADAEAAAKAAAEADRLQKMAYVFGGYFGKERRTRENGSLKDVAADQTLQTLCAPLFGVKGGVVFRPNKARTLEVGPMVGLAVNTKTGSYTSMFAELELNGRFNNRKTYIGTGFGVWDLTHGSWATPSILVNFGQQLWEGSATNRVFFTVEGRLFTRTFGEGMKNNYMYWAGIRYMFR